MSRTETALVIIWMISILSLISYSLGESAGAQTVPMAVIPRDSTVIIYRTIERPQPKPDSTLRYICKETK